jgi:hypothetical protein
MTPLLMNTSRVLFNLPPPTPGIMKVGIVGSGEVVHQRLWPAIRALGASLEGVVVCSLAPQSSLEGLPHHYYQVGPECLLPLDRLYAQGFLGKDTLWIVATPPDMHVPYTVQLARWCRVAVEKPLATTSLQAQLLWPFANGCEVYCLSHKVFNASVLAFIEACRQVPDILRQVSHIVGTFYEMAGFSHGRQQEDCLLDVQWHLFTTALIAPFKAASSHSPFDITVEQAWVATHEPDPSGRYAPPTVWTASRLQGTLAWDGHTVTYDHCQAKGTSTNAKEIRLFDQAGTLLQAIDLNETGSWAHARMLQALLQPIVDMRFTLADAIAGMELIDTSRVLAHEEPSYAFGHIPSFLARGEVSRGSYQAA